MKILKKILSVLFDPFTNIYELDIKNSVNEYCYKHTIICVALALVLAILVIFVLHFIV